MSLRVGIVGLGVISRYYLAALASVPALRLAAVCDRDPARLQTLGARLRTLGGSGVFATERFEALLERDDVQAVIVNLPNDLHAPFCGAALAAGKHVCCEKPLTLAPGDAAQIVALARASGRTLFTAFHRRYNANLAAALRHAPGRGPVRRARVRYDEAIHEHAGEDRWYLRPERCGGGCLADNGPNAFDALRHVCGSPAIRAARLERDGRGVDVRACIELETPGGVPATVELDWAYPDGERKELVLEHAGGARTVVDFLAGYPAFKSSLFHEYVGVLDDFVDRVARGGEDGSDGAEIVELVAAAYERAGQS